MEDNGAKSPYAMKYAAYILDSLEPGNKLIAVSSSIAEQCQSCILSDLYPNGKFAGLKHDHGLSRLRHLLDNI